MKRVYDTNKNEYVMVEDDTPVGEYKPNITKRKKDHAPTHNDQREKNRRLEEERAKRPPPSQKPPAPKGRQQELDEKSSRLINEALMKGIR